MNDTLAKLEKLRADAENCALIGKLAADEKERQLFANLAEHLRTLAAAVERAIEKTRPLEARDRSPSSASGIDPRHTHG